MVKVFNAKISWLLKKHGGRRTLPFGDKYSPIVIVKGSLFNPNEEVWSLIVDNKEVINDRETIAEVKYLSDEAPDNLKTNVEFELHEGIKLVAKGIIL